ncbi:hypothetical protein AVEN_253865-1 [Araneus ventricosus]|uniref:Uncharacterized protein n=1 Tax=Araneus ventricosus TaxID=182803 RepID=A0A4Y2ND70_ARAVE|nr:hypothetical protein AVEN_253865-1 [Araneus ventricosus]
MKHHSSGHKTDLSRCNVYSNSAKRISPSKARTNSFAGDISRNEKSRNMREALLPGLGNFTGHLIICESKERCLECVTEPGVRQDERWEHAEVCNFVEFKMVKRWGTK